MGGVGREFGGQTKRSGQSLCRLLCVAWFLLLWPGIAAAVLPDQALSELRHAHWTLRDGAPPSIRAIVQSRDGFLWLGTATGLYRFDGIRFERVDPEDDARRSLQVTALLAARNGDIWVGYDFGGIGVVRGGKLRGANPWRPSGGVDAIVEGRDGSIWVSSDSRGMLLLARLKNGKWTRIGAAQGYAGGPMGPLLAAADGSIYIATEPRVQRLRPGARRFETLPMRATSDAALAADAQGVIWIGDKAGLRRIDGRGATFPLAGANTPYVRRGMRFDRQGRLWLTGQDDGLARIAFADRQPSRMERMTAGQGLTSSLSVAVAEDREGNIWIGTESGLDRFSASNIVRAALEDALVTGFVPTSDGSSLFIAGLAGIYRIDAGSSAPRLVFARKSIGVLCGDERRLLTFSLTGNFLLDLRAGSVRQVTDIGEPLSIVCALDGQGTFWSGMDRLYRLAGNRLVPADGDGGLKTGTISKLLPLAGGRMIVARASRGLRLYAGGRETLLWRREAQTIGSVTSFAMLGTSVLIGAEAGLGRWDGRGLTQLTARSYPFLTGIMGMRATADGHVWLIGHDGILRVSRAALEAALLRPGAHLPITRFGYYQDYRARSNLNVMIGNDIAEDGTGRLWFATNKGLAYIDAVGIAQNRLAPPVAITGLTAGGRRREPGAALVELPAGTDRLEIDYTALSLTDPQANRFRYRLEGTENAWTEAQDRRQALYTNLAPGTYRFRVIAANNDGVWNERGALLAFRIAPRFYQTWWFAALCAAAGALLLVLLYRRRLAVVAARARAGVCAQLDERERIARELHDTLLQGFQGLMLHFQTAAEQLPPGTRSRETLEAVLDRAEDVLVEGRDRVQALREAAEPIFLSARLQAVIEPVVGGLLRWSVEEQGSVRAVCSPAADELALITQEAASNAVRHAQATQLLVVIRYGRRRLVLTVRDDGRGIAAETLNAGGRSGHFGLRGMRERAEALGGTLSIRVDGARGTTIEVTVPARAVYP